MSFEKLLSLGEGNNYSGMKTHQTLVSIPPQIRKKKKKRKKKLSIWWKQRNKALKSGTLCFERTPRAVGALQWVLGVKQGTINSTNGLRKFLVATQEDLHTQALMGPGGQGPNPSEPKRNFPSLYNKGFAASAQATQAFPCRRLRGHLGCKHKTQPFFPTLNMLTVAQSSKVQQIYHQGRSCRCIYHLQPTRSKVHPPQDPWESQTEGTSRLAGSRLYNHGAMFGRGGGYGYSK